MNSRISLRVEIALAAVLVVVLALVFRAVWLPISWDLHLAAMEDRWGLSVTGVGRWFSAWTLGDGQAFAVIAADPLALDEVGQFGQPAYRFMRAGFGWLAWMGSLGREAWIPYGLALAGALAVAANFGLAAWLRPRLGRSAWLLAFNPAVFIGFAGDTAEGLGVLFLSLALVTGGRWASMLLGLTRPSYLVALAGRFRQMAWGLAATAVLLGYGLVRFGFDLTQFGGRMTFPFVGYVVDPAPMSILIAVLALGTLIGGIRTRDLSWVISGLFVLSLSRNVVADPVNAWRAAGMLPVLWAFGPGYEPTAATSGVGEPASALA